MPLPSVIQAMARNHPHDTYLVATFSCLLVSAVLQVAVPCLNTILSTAIHQSFVATVSLTQRMNGKIPAIPTSVSKSASIIALIPTAIVVTCVPFVMARCWTNKIKKMECFLEKLRFGVTQLRSQGRTVKPQQQQSLKELGETPSTQIQKALQQAPTPIDVLSYLNTSGTLASISCKARLVARPFCTSLVSSMLIFVRIAGATSNATPHKKVDCAVSSDNLDSDCLTENERAVSAGDIVMIVLTAFFGIFIVTAGPWYLIMKIRSRQQSDPEGANGTVIHSDHATFGGDDHTGWPALLLSRFLALCQQIWQPFAYLPGTRHMRASPEDDEEPCPAILETIRFQIPELHELDELGPDEEEAVDPLAEIGVPIPDPTADGQVNIDEINAIIALRTQRESYCVPICENGTQGGNVNMFEVHATNEDASRAVGTGHVDVSMATINKCKTC